jgi:outer membrane lipoprotein carrier protein
MMASLTVAIAVSVASPWSLAVEQTTNPTDALALALAPAPTPAPAPALTLAPAPAAPTLGGITGLFDLGSLAELPLGQNRMTADAVIDKVQAFYKDTTQLRAKFRQTVTNNTFGTKSVSDGYVYIKKPGKMRWDYYSKKTPRKQTKSFISDGTTIWAVFHQDLQYYKKSVKDDLLPVAITFLSGTGDLRKDFNAAIDSTKKFGKKGDHILKLTPKRPNAQYKTLWLVVDPKTFRVKESVVLNANNDTNQFRFYDGDTTKPVLSSWFVFNERANKKYRLVNPDKAPR